MLTNHKDSIHLGSWYIDIRTKKDFFAHLNISEMLVPDVKTDDAFIQLREYLEKKNMFKSAETLYMQTLQEKNRGYKFYDALLKDAKLVHVSKKQWNSLRKYVKDVVLFDNLTGDVDEYFRYDSKKNASLYDLIKEKLDNDNLRITLKVVFFIRGKKIYTRFLYFVNGIFHNQTYQSIVLYTSTYVEIPYMFAAALYHTHILNIDPYQILEQTIGICNMPQDNYEKTKTILEEYINGKELPNI